MKHPTQRTKLNAKKRQGFQRHRGVGQEKGKNSEPPRECYQHRAVFQQENGNVVPALSKQRAREMVRLRRDFGEEADKYKYVLKNVRMSANMIWREV